MTTPLTDLQRRARELAKQGDFGPEAVRVNAAIVEFAPKQEAGWTRLGRCHLELAAIPIGYPDRNAPSPSSNAIAQLHDRDPDHGFRDRRPMENRLFVNRAPGLEILISLERRAGDRAVAHEHQAAADVPVCRARWR